MAGFLHLPRTFSEQTDNVFGLSVLSFLCLLQKRASVLLLHISFALEALQYRLCLYVQLFLRLLLHTCSTSNNAHPDSQPPLLCAVSHRQTKQTPPVSSYSTIYRKFTSNWCSATIPRAVCCQDSGVKKSASLHPRLLSSTSRRDTERATKAENLRGHSS